MTPSASRIEPFHEVDAMALRSSWEGFIRFNLISVPVKAYSASVSGRGKIGFHQIHAKCNRRIRHQKMCPVHGEVSNDEIVSGYEYAKGQYVLIDPDELKKLRPGADKAIHVDVFIHPDALDPMYFTDRTYYLTPDGAAGQKPYALLQKVMADEGRYAVATMVFAGRENVVVVRALNRLLAVTILSYDEQMKKPASVTDEIPDVDVASEELKLARTLIETSTVEDFDFGKYQDEYASEVMKLIEAKAAGKKITLTREQEEPAVINIMDALRRSLERARRGASAKRGDKAGRRTKKSHAGGKMLRYPRRSTA
jgi:DNA end-binding protein Ku